MRALYLMRLFWEIVLRNLRCCLNRWDSADRTVVRKGLNHECEVFRRKCDEAAESQYAWENCKKNPCHEKFIPVHDFIDNHLPESLCDKEREQIVAFVDLTVRIRVSRTSRARPADDVLSNCRGDDRLRVGTGFVWRASSNTNKPCPCEECDGEIMRKHWTFYVRTAQHVVYNTEEAQGTRIDLFYDDENSLENKQAVTVFASRVVWSSAGCDVCHMECVTHDEIIGERIESLLRRVLSLFYCNT